MRIIIVLTVFSISGFAWWLFGSKNINGDLSSNEGTDVVMLPNEPGISEVEFKNKKSFNVDKTVDAKSSVKVTAEHEERYYIVSDNSNYPTFQDRLNEINARRPGAQYNPDKIINALEKESAWEPLGTPPDTLPISNEDKSDGREFISFNTLKIESLMPGDALKLPISETGEYFEMVVDSIYHNDERSLTWHGHLKGHADNAVQITQSDKLTIADIQTPEGNYLLQANGDVGWVVSSATLLNKRNYDQDDVIIPNYDEHDVVMTQEH